MCRGRRKAREARNNFKPSVFRIVIGSIAGYLLPAISLCAVVFAICLWTGSVSVVRWLDYVLAVLICLVALTANIYAYGILHKSMRKFAKYAKKFQGFLCEFFGIIGIFFPPVVLTCYGPNKKNLYMLIVALPCAVCGTLFLLNFMGIFQWDAIFYIAEVAINLKVISLPICIVCYLNSFLALCTKRCKICGCMMTKIVHNLKDQDCESYGRHDETENYQLRQTSGKYYICVHCRHVKKSKHYKEAMEQIDYNN